MCWLTVIPTLRSSCPIAVKLRNALVPGKTADHHAKPIKEEQGTFRCSLAMPNAVAHDISLKDFSLMIHVLCWHNDSTTEFVRIGNFWCVQLPGTNNWTA